jgi:MFS transporter, PAT family, beta-lactamase induction signal transducer AmpG
MKASKNKPWLWVPSLYMTEGLPYVIIIVVSVTMYKNLGIDNSDIGLYTSLLYLPWVIKPFWSPIVDLFGTNKKWFLGMQLLLAACFLAVGMVIPTHQFFILSLACFWMAAFASATNDIASDGFYLMALKEDQQSFFIGLRSTFYRIASVTGQGLIVILAGTLETKFGDNSKAWSLTMLCVGGIIFILTVVNFLTTPNIEEEKGFQKQEKLTFLKVFSSFFQKKEIGIALVFILFYRLGESQLVKMVSPFLLDGRSEGGLGMTTTDVGLLYGTFGVIALTLGGIIGGFVISKDGLGKWFLPMILALNVPNILYYLLALLQPESKIFVGSVVVLEQFGYGFGFAAFMMYLIHIAEGPAKTSHYAIATGFMAMGMMLPGMASGFIQEWLGYENFFLWITVSAMPGIILAKFVKYPKDFGKKKE